MFDRYWHLKDGETDIPWGKDHPNQWGEYECFLSFLFLVQCLPDINGGVCSKYVFMGITFSHRTDEAILVRIWKT